MTAGGDEQHKDRYENTCHAAFIIVHSRGFRSAHERLGSKRSQKITLALAPNIYREAMYTLCIDAVDLINFAGDVKDSTSSLFFSFRTVD